MVESLVVHLGVHQELHQSLLKCFGLADLALLQHYHLQLHLPVQPPLQLEQLAPLHMQ